MKSKLREILREKNISISKFSRDTGISRTTLTAICDGRKHNITVLKAKMIAEAVGRPLAELFPELGN